MGNIGGVLEVEYEIAGGLVQAFGRVNGRGFYFRARHPTWSFEMEDDAGALPSDVGGNPVLCIEGWYSNKREMTQDEAGRIIEKCAAMYADVIDY